jgi:hypothetical protein
MSVKKTVIGLGFTIAMFTSGALGQTPQVFLTVVDTVLCPNVGDPTGGQKSRLLTIRMNNPVVHVGGYQISLSITDPSIINFGYNDIDTVPPDTVIYQDCSPPPCVWDTIIYCPNNCYNYKVSVDTAGTRSGNFDLIQGTRLSEIVDQVSGIAQTSSGPVMQPGNGVLFRVPLIIFPISDSVPLSQRQVKIYFDSIYTTVSDSSGNTVWRADSTASLSLTHGTVTIPFSTKGDCNFDCLLTPTDAVIELGWIYSGSPMPLPSPDVADVNCDGVWTPSDAVLELNRIFLGVPFPC